MPEYARLLVARTARLQLAATKAQRVLLTEKPPASAQAARISRAMNELEADLIRLSHTTAVRSQEMIRNTLEARMVRPDSRGFPQRIGRPHLRDNIQSTPLPAVPGSVGIGDLDHLDKVVSWWWTQEEGYSGHVGRMVYGYFFDAGGGRHRPSWTERGQHAIFQASKPGQRMRIQEPIIGKWFLRDGSAQAMAFWNAEIDRIAADFRKEVIAATAAPGQAPRGGRRRRRRRP